MNLTIFACIPLDSQAKISPGQKRLPQTKKNCNTLNGTISFFLIYNLYSSSYWFNVRWLYWMDDSRLKAAKSVFLTRLMSWWNWSIRIDFDTFWENFLSFLWWVIKYEQPWIIHIKINLRKFMMSYLSNSLAISRKSKADRPPKGIC